MTELRVTDVAPRVQYTADGSQADFTVPFFFFAAADLQVAFDDGDLPAPYGVLGAGYAGGGIVRFVDPPAAGTRISIWRQTVRQRAGEFQPGGDFRAAAINEELDRLALMIQEVADAYDRTMALAPSASPVDLHLSAPDPEKYLRWSADGAHLESVAAVAPGSLAVSGFGETLLDDADAAAARATLGLTTGTAGDAGKLAMLDAAGTGFAFVGQWPGCRNLLRNGAMRIAQQGDSAAGLGAATGYPAGGPDLWKAGVSGSPQARWTLSRESAAGPPGFANWLKIAVTTAEAGVDAGEAQYVGQAVAARDLQQLAYGSAGARPLTLSFWHRSPKPGTHSVCLYRPGSDRHYASEFTVAAADTWQRHVLSVDGDTAASIADGAGAGLWLYVPLIIGSGTGANSNDTWLAGGKFGSYGQQNLADTVGNVIGLTGVQLEAGDAATDYECLPQAIEQARVFEDFEIVGNHALATVLAAGFAQDATRARFFTRVGPKRTDPTVAKFGSGTLSVKHQGSQTAVTALVGLIAGRDGTAELTVDVAGGLGAGEGVTLLHAADTGFQFDARF
jgi:hypothetical protein